MVHRSIEGADRETGAPTLTGRGGPRLRTRGPAHLHIDIGSRRGRPGVREISAGPRKRGDGRRSGPV